MELKEKMILEGNIEKIEKESRGQSGILVTIWFPKYLHQLPNETENVTKARLDSFDRLHLGKCNLEQIVSVKYNIEDKEKQK